MGIPEIIYIVFMAVSYGCMINVVITKKKVEEPSVLLVTITMALLVGLVFWGGFFSNGFGIPQIIWIVGNGIGYGVTLSKQGAPAKIIKAYSLIPPLIGPTCLYYGGFFS